MTEWRKGELLDDEHRQAVIKEAALVTLRNAVPAFLLAVVCFVPAIKLVRVYNSWYLFVVAAAFVLIGFLYARSGLKRISAIKNNHFEWVEDTVTDKEFGGRYSHSYVIGENGCQYYTQHLLTGYAKGSRIIGIKYRVGETSLGDDLTYLHDPLAYKTEE